MSSIKRKNAEIDHLHSRGAKKQCSSNSMVPCEQKADRQTVSSDLDASELLTYLKTTFPEKTFRLSTFRRKGKYSVQMKCGTNWNKTCVHARNSIRCTLCGDGASLCVHRKRKLVCASCGGKGLCAHEKQRHQCSLCGYCKHGKTPRRCRKGCGGAAFCRHGTRKARCLKCGGGDMCKTHQQRKEFCEPPCGTGSGLCQTVDCRKIRVKDGFCQCCHPDYVEKCHGVSLMGCRFIDALEEQTGYKIQHSHYNDDKTLSRNEFRPPEKKQSPVDGYNKNENIIVEFLGDEFHGHPMTPIRRKRDKNYCGTDYEVLFERTEAKFSLLSSYGYKIKYIWECDYLEFVKRHKLDKTVTLALFTRDFDGELQW